MNGLRATVFLLTCACRRDLPSFPTRRSSDLTAVEAMKLGAYDYLTKPFKLDEIKLERDRKSTRLNSSHLGISYAVFCLKKKNTAGFHAAPARLHPVVPNGRVNALKCVISPHA